MAKIVEKGTSGLFDNEIEFSGKYDTYARFLRDEIGLFTTFREVYVTSAIVGLLCYKSQYEAPTISETKIEEKATGSVFPNELSKRRLDLGFIYRAIMILHNSDDLTIDDLKNKAFREDNEEYPELLRANMREFNDIAALGLCYLYDKFKDCERIEDTVDTLYEYIHEIAVGCDLIEGEDELPEFNPEYR